MDSTQLPVGWPIWAVIVYLFVKDALPILATLFTKITGMILPFKANEKKLLMEQQAAINERQNELEEKRIDLREREVIALEQIGKSLVVIDTRLQAADRKEDLIITGLITANNALGIVLDRVHRRREDYDSPIPKPVS